MNKILAATTTMAGSTVDVAQAVDGEMTQSGVQVDILPMSVINGREAYDAVPVGGPMILGWLQL